MLFSEIVIVLKTSPVKGCVHPQVDTDAVRGPPSVPAQAFWYAEDQPSEATANLPSRLPGNFTHIPQSLKLLIAERLARADVRLVDPQRLDVTLVDRVRALGHLIGSGLGKSAVRGWADARRTPARTAEDAASTSLNRKGHSMMPKISARPAASPARPRPRRAPRAPALRLTCMPPVVVAARPASRSTRPRAGPRTAIRSAGRCGGPSGRYRCRRWPGVAGEAFWLVSAQSPALLKNGFLTSAGPS